MTFVTHIGSLDSQGAARPNDAAIRVAAPICPLCGSADTDHSFKDSGCALRVCNICELFFVHPYPTSEEQHTQVSSGEYSEIELLDCKQRYRGERLYYERHFRTIAEECVGASSLLDVGCGTGHLLERFADHADMRRLGIELNAQAAQFARCTAGCEIRELPLEQFRSEEQFDVITMVNVFSHIPSFDGMFRSLRAALSPNGKLILRTSEMSRGVSRWNQVHWGIPDDLHFLGLGTIDFICARYGFEVVRRVQTAYEDELFRLSRWQQMGRSQLLNLAKKAGIHIPGALRSLRMLYAGALGRRLYVSLIVLKPLAEPGPSSAVAMQSIRPTNGTLEGLTHMGDKPMREKSSNNAVRSPFLVRTVRTQPHLYSAICKARLLYSRRIAGAEMRGVFHRNRVLFAMDAFEAEQEESLRNDGYALLPEFFPTALIGRIYAKADEMFRNLQIDLGRAYSVQTGARRSLQGLSYDELASTEKMIALRDPLIHIPELLGVAFHESILKIAANFLGYVPPLYRATVVRDFPHNRALHSSNFHKDNDESDSLQIFIYLVDIDDTCGPLIYVPGSNHYDVRSCRPRLSRDLGIASNDGRLSDEEVERVYPRNMWATLRTRRGSVAAIHGNGIHKGPAWKRLGNPNNRPRTAIKLDLHGYKAGVARQLNENRILKTDFEQMTDLQRLFAHATLVENPVPVAMHATA